MRSRASSRRLVSVLHFTVSPTRILECVWSTIFHCLSQDHVFFRCPALARSCHGQHFRMCSTAGGYVWRSTESKNRNNPRLYDPSQRVCIQADLSSSHMPCAKPKQMALHAAACTEYERSGNQRKLPAISQLCMESSLLHAVGRTSSRNDQ